MPIATHLDFDQDSLGAIMDNDGREALLNDVRKGFHARSLLMWQNQAAAARAAEKIGRGGSFFETTAIFDAHHFLTTGMERGVDAWHDDEFINDSIKRIENSTPRYSKKGNRVGFTGAGKALILPATKYTPVGF